jgi:hypothetical protein
VNTKDDRWSHLVSAAFQLEAARLEPVTLVDSALEVFDAELDPVRDFEGYAVRRFLLALRQVLPAP